MPAPYFDASPFDGAEVPTGAAKSRRLQLYEQFAATRFAAVPPALTRAELEGVQAILASRLDAEREERRMHFGAFALVTLLFMLVFLHGLQAGFSNLAVDLLAALLLALVVSYVFVYFGYENRVRAMLAGRLRLLEALARLDEEAR